MLNGVDPILLFNFYKKQSDLPDDFLKLALIEKEVSRFALPPIPLYLSEKLTGIFIDTESKNIDIDTSIETQNDGSSPFVNQKGVASVTTINAVAKKGSIGLSLISAMAEVILNRVSSKEYSISYLHGATTIFEGLLHQFEVSADADTDILKIQIQLSTGTKAGPPVPVVSKVVGTVPA